jgi:SagB-type dehydrogenase family enzyme
MRVKVAECAVLFWDQGRLVWDDYLHHRQLALRPDSERLLRWFASWRQLESVSELEQDPDGGRLEALAYRLLEAGVLIAEHGETARAEEALLARWRQWGAAATYYHFATRTLDGTRYLDARADADREQIRLALERAPDPFKTYPDRAVTALPEAREVAQWDRPGLLDALLARRSTRSFSEAPVSFEAIAGVLRHAAGVTGLRGPVDQGPAVFRSSPSAGARAPIEVYLLASRVSDLEPGIYHFAPIGEQLEQLGSGAEPEQLGGALGGQQWLIDAAALLIYTGVVERSQWRYETSRAYRDVLLSLGHLSQTVQLLATGLGLGSLFATAVCDEDLETLLEIDPVQEAILGVTAIGGMP